METARPLGYDAIRVRFDCTGSVLFRAAYALLIGLGILFWVWLTGCSPASSIPGQQSENTLRSATTTPLRITSSPTQPELPATGTTPPTSTLSATSTPENTLTPTLLPCWSEGGQIVELTIDTPLSQNPWPFRVYTPPCYTQQPDRRYPLLILMHGTSFEEDQWDRIGVDEMADTLIGNGDLPPFLILMPFDWYWTYEPFRDPFGDALINNLIPWMDENYRTLPDREYRAIGGLSRGASWAVHLGLKHWELFSTVGGHSLPVFPSDPPFIEQFLREIPRESVPRFFLDMGEEDNLLDKALWFENLLNANNVPHEWYLFPGTHEEAYWTAHLEQYLRWYAAEWSHLQ